MNNSGGNRASGGASPGIRLIVLGTAAGALGYAVVYFFDPSLGEERRRRVLEAANAAMQEVVLLSQRLVAGAAAPEAEYEPSQAPAPERLVEQRRDYHELTREPDMTGRLHEKVTFFRLGEEEAEEAPVLAPVAVIAQELPAEQAPHEPARHEPPYDPPALAPTIIAYDADPEPEPVPEAPPAAGDAAAGAGRCSLPPPSSPSSWPPRRSAPGRSGAEVTRIKPPPRVPAGAAQAIEPHLAAWRSANPGRRVEREDGSRMSREQARLS